MQTAIIESLRDTPIGREADKILRTCVHCGFCNATCPTYQILFDELDGPRGRIYLMKQVLEGHAPTAKTLTHLDRCLTCRACETTCPSGVRYGALLEIGRELVERQVPRPLAERLMRRALLAVIPYRERFTPLLRIGQWLRPFLPPALKRSVPPHRDVQVPRETGSRERPARTAAPAWPSARHARKMLVLEGCAQPALAPGINAAAARVLDRLGIGLIAADGAGCCGAASHHTSAMEEGLEFARRNIDAWWPHVEAGAEAIVMTASGCGVHVKEYGHLLASDAAYAARAKRVAKLTKDLSEILAGEDLGKLKGSADTRRKVAFQSPCTLQHGQKLNGVVEKILRDLGFTLTVVPDAHLCCGSAGTYSILQKSLSQQLLERKVNALQSDQPDIIATANIGCLAHLQTGATLPVRHWIELL
jgi:glycolate oxidase iron-sulfur subunit